MIRSWRDRDACSRACPATFLAGFRIHIRRNAGHALACGVSTEPGDDARTQRVAAISHSTHASRCSVDRRSSRSSVAARSSTGLTSIGSARFGVRVGAFPRSGQLRADWLRRPRTRAPQATDARSKITAAIFLYNSFSFADQLLGSFGGCAHRGCRGGGLPTRRIRAIGVATPQAS